MCSDLSLNCHAGLTIVAHQLNGEGLILFCHLKARMVMDARKQPATNEGVEFRSSVSPGNIDTFSIFAMLFPLYSNTVSRILGCEAKRGGQCSWADLFQANETDACHSHSMDQFWAKWGGQESLERAWIDTIIHEEAPINGAFEGRNLHVHPP